jgi:phospholipid/cholesterol/gamma-HCH transport system substrate-binding protein
MAALISRKRLVAATAALLTTLLAGATIFVVNHKWLGPRTVTAYFAAAASIYPGDDVRVAGVKVGRVADLQPDGPQVKLILSIDHGVPIPIDAKAVLVAPNLVAARYIQLAPAYRSNGAKMPDGAVIPIERTAVPVEWDQVKQQLTRLATEMGPNSDVSRPSVARFIDSAANALDGNGAKLRQTLAQLSGVANILARGGGDIVGTIRDLQILVAALRDSKQQIVEFQDRFATLTSVLDGSRSDLDGALKNLAEAVGEVHRFISGTRDGTAEQIQRLANVTQNLVDHRMDLEQVLHVSPTALANTYNMFDPRTGSAGGEFVLNFTSDVTRFLMCEMSQLDNVTAVETGKLCQEYLGPAADRLTFNNLPIPINPFQEATPPWQDLVYSEARLEPGGLGPKPQPPDLPPAVSAYTGVPGDTPESNWPPAPDTPNAPPPQSPPPPTVPAGPAPGAGPPS